MAISPGYIVVRLGTAKRYKKSGATPGGKQPILDFLCSGFILGYKAACNPAKTGLGIIHALGYPTRSLKASAYFLRVFSMTSTGSEGAGGVLSQSRDNR